MEAIKVGVTDMQITEVDQFPRIKIQHKTIHLSTKLQGKT